MNLLPRLSELLSEEIICVLTPDFGQPGNQGIYLVQRQLTVVEDQCCRLLIGNL